MVSLPLHRANAVDDSGSQHDAGSKTILVARRCGRLANRLVLAANIMAFAQDRAWQVYDPTLYTYAEYFEQLRDNVFYRFPAPEVPRRWAKLAHPLMRTKCGYHVVRHTSHLVERVPGLSSLACTISEPADGTVLELDSPAFDEACGQASFIFLRGWLIRASQSVKRHGDEIRRYFRPDEAFRARAETRVHALRQRNDVVVGIHIRQGDYRTWLDGKYFFPTPTYARWMRSLAATFVNQRVGFLICGDEPHHEREFDGLSVCCQGGHLVEDLHALSCCDYLLGVQSTYSQWASFYGQVPLFRVTRDDDEIELAKFRVSSLEFLPF
jgi:hypothetical protein